MKKLKLMIRLKLILIFILTGILIFSVYKLVVYYKETNEYKSIELNILKNVDIKEVEINEDILVGENIYYKYINTPLIDVDLNKLLETNDDTIGWLQVLGTDINYPIVQSDDNEYYTKKNYLKKYSNGGWIFLDYRNDINNLDFNNIIYGHRLYNGTMFGTLKKVLTDDWYNNVDNHIIKISTFEYNYLFQIFSVYVIPNETYYLNINYYDEFLTTITERSKFDFNAEVTGEDKIITLSTCHNANSTERLVVHAKLIKQQKK